MKTHDIKIDNNLVLKNIVKSLLEENGYIKVDSETDIYRFSKTFVSKPKYKSIYGNSSTSDFMVFNIRTNRKTRIEVKWQQTSGSVEQKFPYFYINATTAMPKDEDVIYILSGEGHSYGAKKWFKKAAEQNSLQVKKSIKVMSLSEFSKFIKES